MKTASQIRSVYLAGAISHLAAFTALVVIGYSPGEAEAILR